MISSANKNDINGDGRAFLKVIRLEPTALDNLKPAKTKHRGSCPTVEYKCTIYNRARKDSNLQHAIRAET
jgi:hypothetical protein